jgi:gliding motility-associated-like protein
VLSIKHFFLFLMVVLSKWVAAQVPVAGFSNTPTSGCAPLVVTFKDQSSGDPKFWNWDFGNGQLSNVQNPIIVFNQPGVYSVTLVVKNANGTHGITKDSLITVHPSPQAGFDANIRTGCNPVNVQFSDLSSDPAGNIISWEWDFGDGTKSTQRNPQKNYNVNGFYSVSLTVTSSTGCKSTSGASRYIRIVSGVKADFTNTTTSDCRPPFTAIFKNESAGPGSLTYAWDFGNGNTSTQANPTIPYSATGTYPVSLTTTSDFGCRNTIQKDVQIRGSNTVIGGPDSICVNKPLNFINSSTPAPVSSIWYFDDGTQSTAINASKSFSVVGQHVVKLVNTYAFCKDSITKTIHVLAPPSVDFTSSTVLACKPPLTVNFSDNSPTTAVAWFWEFGDGGTSTLENPSHVYSSAGQFDVALTITSSFGCTNKLQKNVFVQIVRPVVNISDASDRGCIPFTYSPTPNVQTVDGVASYSWNFGDGPGSIRTGPAPSYTYTTPGNYSVTLTITTIGGCVETSAPKTIRTGTPPVVDFTVNKTAGCASEVFQFTNLAVPSTEWLWDFNDGNTDTAQHPLHKFGDTGKIAVKLSAFNNGCMASITKADLVTITPPVSRFRDTVMDCNDQFNVTFVNNSILHATNSSDFLWDFGDGRTSTDRNPTHLYNGPGVYDVKLTVTDAAAGCTHTFTKLAYLDFQTAQFSASKTSVCVNENINLAASGDAASITRYQWRLGNGTFFDGGRSFDTSFSTPGNHEIALVITNKYGGCTDTVVRTGYITVLGPVADFSPNVTGNCQDQSVTFTDQSSSVANIVRWTWDFGDSTVQSFTAPPFMHTYQDTGKFTIKLTVLDAIGCSNSVTKDTIVSVTRPQAYFGTKDTIYCQGAALQFLDSSKGKNLTYAWEFGDGGVSTLQDPTHIYTGADATYSVKLKVTDLSGCTDSITRTNFVDIRFPKAASNAVDTISICPPLETKFFFQGSDYESFSWDFGDGAGSTLKDPTHFYNTYGTFNAKLYVFGYGGCIDSSSHTVNVYNPNSTTSITYSPLDACNSLNVDFSIVTPAQTRFTFFFGDGRVDSSQVKTFTHFYNAPSFYTPSLLLYDNLGCIAPISGAQQIKILGAIPNFGRDKREFCDTGVVFFTNYTIANDPIVSSVWNFDDGTTSTDVDPIHYFGGPDQYAVSLSVTTQAGCSSSIVDTIRAYRTPVPSINSINTACINAPVLFNGILAVPDTAIVWKWDLGNGQTSSLQDISSIYTRTGTYKLFLEAANKLGCKNSTTKDLVVAPLPIITMGSDPVIPVGTGIDLPVTYNSNMKSYTWTPTRDLSCISCDVPFANPKFTTRYKVSVVDSNNCRASNDITVNVVCNNKNYFVPNTFTPNGDGTNDVFYPRGSSIDRVQSMRIFNRWGQIVYEKRNFMVNSMADGWNGLYQGKPANMDTYIYTIEFICENAEIITYKGNVTLLR